jgi:hypothetical protein
VSESWLTDDEIAEFTSTHDHRTMARRDGGFTNVIPTAEVIAYLRTMRDRAQAHMDTLLLAQAASAHDRQGELLAACETAREAIEYEGDPRYDALYDQLSAAIVAAKGAQDAK